MAEGDSVSNDKFLEFEEKITDLTNSVQDIQLNQKTMSQHLRVANICSRLDGLEKRQEEVIKLLSNLRNELAGISSGMARRDNIMLNTGVGLRREFSDPGSRRNSGLLSADGIIGKTTVPVMEVEPWTPTPQVKQVIDRLIERQFLLSPWMKEKRLRNQLRLILKDHLEAGPQRRSTVTKIVHDAHQNFPVWRGQIKDTMFENWERVQVVSFKEAAQIIFGQFKKSRFSDEQEAIELYAEHMIEVGQYLRRKASERAEKAGKIPQSPGTITNSKYWYEVRKKINEVLESKKDLVRRQSSSQIEGDSDGDDESYHSPASNQDEKEEVEAENKPTNLVVNRVNSDSGVDVN